MPRNTLLKLYRTLWSGTRNKRVSVGPAGHCKRLDWKATVVLEIDELRLRALIDVAAKSMGKRTQRGPLRLRLEKFQEREIA